MGGWWELAHGSDLWRTAEMEGWVEVGHPQLAGGGESRRPKGVSNSEIQLRCEIITMYRCHRE